LRHRLRGVVGAGSLRARRAKAESGKALLAEAMIAAPADEDSVIESRAIDAARQKTRLDTDSGVATWNDHDAAIKKALFDAECLAFTQSVSDTTQLTAKQRRVYDRAFVLIDDDGSGATGPEELVLIMSHLGKPMSLRRATAILAVSDSAGTSAVERDEFPALMLKLAELQEEESDDDDESEDGDFYEVGARVLADWDGQAYPATVRRTNADGSLDLLCVAPSQGAARIPANTPPLKLRRRRRDRVVRSHLRPSSPAGRVGSAASAVRRCGRRPVGIGVARGAGRHHAADGPPHDHARSRPRHLASR